MSATPTADPNRIPLGPQTAHLIGSAFERHRQLGEAMKEAAAEINRLLAVTIEASGRELGPQARWTFEPGEGGAFLVRAVPDSPPPAPRLLPRDDPPDASGAPVPAEPSGPHNPEPAAAPAAGG